MGIIRDAKPGYCPGFIVVGDRVYPVTRWLINYDYVVPLIEDVHRPEDNWPLRGPDGRVWQGHNDMKELRKLFELSDQERKLVEGG